MKLNQKLKFLAISLILIALGNSYGQDDNGESIVAGICRFTERRLESLSLPVDRFQKDYVRINWFFYQDVSSWWSNRQYDQELKVLEQRWHNLGCIHYDIERNRKSKR